METIFILSNNVHSLIVVAHFLRAEYRNSQAAKRTEESRCINTWLKNIDSREAIKNFVKPLPFVT